MDQDITFCELFIKQPFNKFVCEENNGKTKIGHRQHHKRSSALCDVQTKIQSKTSSKIEHANQPQAFDI